MYEITPPAWWSLLVPLALVMVALLLSLDFARHRRTTGDLDRLLRARPLWRGGRGPRRERVRDRRASHPSAGSDPPIADTPGDVLGALIADKRRRRLCRPNDTDISPGI